MKPKRQSTLNPRALNKRRRMHRAAIGPLVAEGLESVWEGTMKGTLCFTSLCLLIQVFNNALQVPAKLRLSLQWNPLKHLCFNVGDPVVGLVNQVFSLWT